MKRKIIKQGIGGNTIFLPIDWIRSHGLKAGDEVEIIQKQGGLFITSELKKNKKSISIKLNDESDTYLRILMNFIYRLGYDTVEIKANSESQIQRIEYNVKHYLLGFDITKKNAVSLVIENIAEPSVEKQETLSRRMYFLIGETFDVLIDDMKKQSYKSLQNIYKLSLKIGQCDNFCRRNIGKRSIVDEKSFIYWTLYSYLLLTQHNLWHLYEAIEEKKPKKISKNFTLLYEEAHSDFKAASEFFFQKNIEELKKISDKLRHFLPEKIYPMMAKANGFDAIVCYYIGELSRLIYFVTIYQTAVLLEQSEKIAANP